MLMFSRGRPGQASLAWPGQACPRLAKPGLASPSWPGLAQPGQAWPGWSHRLRQGLPGFLALPVTVTAAMNMPAADPTQLQPPQIYHQGPVPLAYGREELCCEG